MRHVPDQDNLVPTRLLNRSLKLRTSEGSRIVLGDGRLGVGGRQLGEYLCEIGRGRKDGCAVGGLMHDVDERRRGGAVLLQQRLDGGARGGDVFGLELPGDVPVCRCVSQSL